MKPGAQVALAVSVGYLLGRTRKMKLALAFGMVLVGQRLPKNSLELVQQALKTVASSDQFSQLSQQVTGNLADAGRAAAGKSVERLLERVTDRLNSDLGSDQDEQSRKKSDEDADARPQ
ncbi:MAG TPA: hypothetical protein VK020_03575, partial [Microlunatus sp.]|nr:hypothetical protein [Microlunatus sp.]